MPTDSPEQKTSGLPSRFDYSKVRDILFFTVLAIATLPSRCSLAEGANRPNILLILADDLGWADTSFTGSTYYRTPNIERLARRGMYFLNAYSASPLCSPTRASIMTGQSPARVGITTPACHLAKEVMEAGVALRGPPPQRQLQCSTATRLKLEYYTLAEALKAAGYATGHFGKWHLGREPYDPLHQGFDVDVPHWWGPGPAGSYVAPWKFPNFRPRTPKEHLEDRMGDEAVAFMEKHRGEPFFLNYWQFSVHAPFNAKEELIAEYRERLDPRNPQRSPTYAAMVHSLDDNVGKMLDALDRLGIRDNTIIIFYSDNGGNMYNEIDGTSPTSNLPLRGGKATLYEGGIRIPAIVVWPGTVQGGTRNGALIQSEDLYPTILEITGARAKPGQPCDGLSMVPLLKGEGPLRREVFCFFPHRTKVPDWLPPAVSVRQGDWKLIRIFFDGEGQQHRYELYNLKDDIGERNNLASARPEKVKALDALLDRFLSRTGAVVPRPNPAYDPKAVTTVSGWQVSANAGADISYSRSRKALQFRAFRESQRIVTAGELKLPPGRYSFQARMSGQASGDGAIYILSGKKLSPPFALSIQHDRHWRNCRTEMTSDRPITGIRFMPCRGQGTVLVKSIRLNDSEGKTVKAWSFEKGPPKKGRRPQPVAGGWRAGPNGHAACTLQKGYLHITTSRNDPMLMTAQPLKAGPGEYVFRFRMRSKSRGAGLFFGRPANRSYLPGTGTPIVMKHDGQWHEYEVKVKFDHPLVEFRLDPCTGPGQLDIDWMRLTTAGGKLIREWTFGGPQGVRSK